MYHVIVMSDGDQEINKLLLSLSIARHMHYVQNIHISRKPSHTNKDLMKVCSDVTVRCTQLDDHNHVQGPEKQR